MHVKPYEDWTTFGRSLQIFSNRIWKRRCRGDSDHYGLIRFRLREWRRRRL